MNSSFCASSRQNRGVQKNGKDDDDSNNDDDYDDGYEGEKVIETTHTIILYCYCMQSQRVSLLPG